MSKKITLIVLGGLLLSVPVAAQRFVPSLGINGGMAGTMFQNEFYTTHNLNNNIQFAPNFGLQLIMTNPERSDVYFGLGLRYSNFKQDFNIGDTTAFGMAFFYTNRSKATLSYLSVPINIGYQFKMGRLSPFASIGIAPAYLFNYEQSSFSKGYLGTPLYETIDKTGVFVADVPGAVIGGKNDYDGAGIYKSFNVFAHANLGVNIELSKRLYCSIALNYNQSLLFVEDHNAFKKGYWGYADFYTSRGYKEEQIVVNSDIPGNIRVEKPNRYKTKLAAFGINIGVNYIF
jgi:hypothetical protein